MHFIAGVNRLVNSAVTYKSDDHRDEWQSPTKTAEIGTGDCDDQAIIKMAMLERLLPDADLRLMYVTTREGIPHMVLGVGDLVLDNMSDDLKTLEQLGYSQPFYTIDARGVVYDHEGNKSKARVEKFDSAMRKK